MGAMKAALYFLQTFNDINAIACRQKKRRLIEQCFKRVECPVT